MRLVTHSPKTKAIIWGAYPSGASIPPTMRGEFTIIAPSCNGIPETVCITNNGQIILIHSPQSALGPRGGLYPQGERARVMVRSPCG
jgi:hypothetical protein